MKTIRAQVLWFVGALWAALSACQATTSSRTDSPQGQDLTVEASPKTRAYNRAETLEFFDRLSFYRAVNPQGLNSLEEDDEAYIALTAYDGELLPIFEKGRPAGARIISTQIIHPNKGVVYGRLGDGVGEIFGIGFTPGLDVSAVDRTTNPRVLEAVLSYEPAESVGPCRQGACPIETNGFVGGALWLAVRVLDGHEYLAGWFPDFDPDPDGLRVPVLFDKWIAEIEAQWGVATSR